ncbi:hypothetical protein HYH03_004623 [Edaphochlamys debaryana]|uniref:PPM-type phosphatase domain-containing protein n=1 Tax=Edaphochlamys debaryana TaxID=47281 RepID=A0A835Y9Y6_9CHLO|nr:hypothetical protein HYH03_004623 [Edaphochlamys debaryana]|eukprot:KAG2497468.1 hypothetical protein HYH03_004623 [Edaphochlamys debaryana]
MNSEPPTPTSQANGVGATRPSQTPTRGATLGNTLSSPKIGPGGYVPSSGPPGRRNSGNGNLAATAPPGSLSNIARLVEAGPRSGPSGTFGGPNGAMPGALQLNGGGPPGTLQRGNSGQFNMNMAGLNLSSSLPTNTGSRPPTQSSLLATAPPAVTGSRPGTGTLGRASSSVPGLTFSVGSNQSMGSRGYQEDYRTIADPTSTPGMGNLPNLLLGAAVYDGHGGKQVSHWLSSSYCLLNRAMEAVQALVAGGGSPNDVAAVLEEVFVGAGNAALAGRMTAGSCVAMALLVQAGGVPWVLSANVGDSRSVMVSWDDAGDLGATGGGGAGRPDATQLSVDHKLGPAKLSEETRRVQAAGGTVIQLFGTWRIDGSLAVARAIGDADFARYVSTRPTVSCRQLLRRDRWLIIASDGLWDVMTNEDVAHFCKAQHQLSAAKLSEALLLPPSSLPPLLAALLRGAPPGALVWLTPPPELLPVPDDWVDSDDELLDPYDIGLDPHLDLNLDPRSMGLDPDLGLLGDRDAGYWGSTGTGRGALGPGPGEAKLLLPPVTVSPAPLDRSPPRAVSPRPASRPGRRGPPLAVAYGRAALAQAQGHGPAHVQQGPHGARLGPGASPGARRQAAEAAKVAALQQRLDEQRCRLAAQEQHLRGLRAQWRSDDAQRRSGEGNGTGVGSGPAAKATAGHGHPDGYGYGAGSGAGAGRGQHAQHAHQAQPQPQAQPNGPAGRAAPRGASYAPHAQQGPAAPPYATEHEHAGPSPHSPWGAQAQHGRHGPAPQRTPPPYALHAEAPHAQHGTVSRDQAWHGRGGPPQAQPQQQWQQQRQPMVAEAGAAPMRLPRLGQQQAAGQTPQQAQQQRGWHGPGPARPPPAEPAGSSPGRSRLAREAGPEPPQRQASHGQQGQRLPDRRLGVRRQ